MYILNLKGGSQKSLTHNQIGLLLKVLILIFRRTALPTPHTLTLLSVSLKLQQLMKYSAALTKKKM